MVHWNIIVIHTNVTFIIPLHLTINNNSAKYPVYPALFFSPFSAIAHTHLHKFLLTEENPPPQPSFLEASSYPTQIIVRWQPPQDTSIMVRGYMLGYGHYYPDREVLQLGAGTRQHTITNLQPNAEYVIKLRAFNNRGEGFPLFETVFTRPPASKFLSFFAYYIYLIF